MIIEPSSDIRLAANVARQIYLAYVSEGFTEAQALELVKAVVSAGQS